MDLESGVKKMEENIMGARGDILKASVFPHTQVITKPGFVCFIASTIFLIQKAASVIKYLEERKQKVQS